MAIVALNEQEHLPKCLESVHGLAAEIVLIDSGSTDRTKEIAEQFGARFEFHQWPGYIAQKNFALERCTQPWILCLDADEWLSPELQASLRQFFAAGEPRENGLSLDRLNFYLGAWIHHCWSPEWKLRLIRRGHGRWGGMDPHDKLDVDGPTGKLQGHLMHYTFSSIHEHMEKTVKFSRLAAEAYAQAGRRCKWRHLVISPWMAWFKSIIIKQGWRDGWRGWVIAGSRWMNVFMKYAYLHEMQRQKNDPHD